MRTPDTETGLAILAELRAEDERIQRAGDIAHGAALAFGWGWAAGLLVALLAACEPLPPPEPPEPEATCAESCARLEQWECKAGNKVCNGFNDDGACYEWITCAGDCERAPQAHPKPACVMALDVVEGDPCEAVDELCW